MIASPDVVRRRKLSVVCGFSSALMPIFFHWSMTKVMLSTSSAFSLECSTTNIAGWPLGSRRMPSLPFLVSPISSSSLLAALTS